LFDCAKEASRFGLPERESGQTKEWVFWFRDADWQRTMLYHAFKHDFRGQDEIEKEDEEAPTEQELERDIHDQTDWLC